MWFKWLTNALLTQYVTVAAFSCTKQRYRPTVRQERTGKVQHKDLPHQKNGSQFSTERDKLGRRREPRASVQVLHHLNNQLQTPVAADQKEGNVTGPV